MAQESRRRKTLRSACERSQGTDVQKGASACSRIDVRSITGIAFPELWLLFLASTSTSQLGGKKKE